MNHRGPENGIVLLAVATAMAPVAWTSNGFGWLAPWTVTLGLYFLSALLAVVAMWFVGGFSVWVPSLADILRCLAAVLGLAMASEVLARAVLDETPRRYAEVRGTEQFPAPFVVDSRFGWRVGVADTIDWRSAGAATRYRFDGVGFRVPETASVAAVEGSEGRRGRATLHGPPMPKLAFVGDGLTFGVGVRYEATFAALVANATDHRPVNLARVGFGVADFARVLEREARRRRPRAVVVAFADPVASRDALNAPVPLRGVSGPRFSVVNDALQLPAQDDRPALLFRWLERHSRSWAALYSLDDRIGRYYEWGENAVLRRHLFERMIRLAEQAHVPILFVRLPLPLPVEHPYLQAVFHRRGAPYVDLGAEGVQRPAGIHFSTTGEDGVDALFDRTGHLSPAGHGWVARELRPAVIRLITR